jgi:hypothetical protein
LHAALSARSAQRNMTKRALPMGNARSCHSIAHDNGVSDRKSGYLTELSIAAALLSASDETLSAEL